MTDTPPLTEAFSPWLGRGGELHERFVGGEPFPLIVLDGFLVDDLARRLCDEFPPLDAMPKSRDYIFGDKRELSSVEGTAAGAAFRHGVLSEDFQRFLVELTGEPLFVDPAFHGGGYHQGGDGSYLDLHVDFNVHPEHPTWWRRLNILVYLNEGWDPSYGGQLILRAGSQGSPTEISPEFNRAVIMLTDDRTYHGYRRMSLPPGVSRKSVASYAYREVAPGEVKARTTGWKPEDAGVAKRFVARHYDRLVRVKNRFFGSGTARNR